MKRGIVAGFFAVSSSVTTFAGIAPLSQMQPGDRLHVSYHTRGCFSDQKYEIDFERAASVIARSSDHTIRLSAKEVAGLDKLFQFYHSRPRGGCTTQDEIQTTQFRSGQKISSEHYVDGSCATYQMKGVTRLYEIAKKLRLVDHDT